MEEKSKIVYVVSLHLAVFAAGASANGSVGASFVLGGISTLLLLGATGYEVIFVSPNIEQSE